MTGYDGGAFHETAEVLEVLGQTGVGGGRFGVRGGESREEAMIFPHC